MKRSRMEPLLSDEKLAEMRDRKNDPLQFHNILLAQSDREALLRHIHHLNRLLEESESEQARLRRSLE